MEIDWNQAVKMVFDNWAIVAVGGGGFSALAGLRMVRNLAVSAAQKIIMADGDEWQRGAVEGAFKLGSKAKAIEWMSDEFDARQAKQVAQLERLKWKPKKK